MAYAVVKRLLDVTASTAACIILLPLFLLLAILIQLESSGSPVFLQQRIGRHGIPFLIYKFRSMVANAPSLGSWQTQENDPRITRVGKFIRATSLDELPQLWNVLTGDMSLIGPRPEVPARQFAYSAADWELRHRVRPGLTGLAQVNGRSDLSDAEQLRYDLEYATHPTFAADMAILGKTLAIVLKKSGTN